MSSIDFVSYNRSYGNGRFMIAPYGISAAFFLFLGSWIVYFSIRKGKKGFAAGLYIMFLAAAVPLFFYDQTNVPTDTMIKRNILIQIREWTQGKGYLAVGGIGNGKLRSVGECFSKRRKIISGVCPGKCRSVSEGIC